MAESIVTQRDRYCKVENNPKMDLFIDKYGHFGMPHYSLFAAILCRSNRDATEFLKSIGCNAVIPHTYHIPLEEAARFYNVGPEYMRNLLNRLGFNTTSIGNEYISADPVLYFYRAEIRKFAKFAPVSGPAAHTTYDLVFEGTDEHYVMKTRKKTTQFVSARIILALAPIIANTYVKRNPSHKSVTVKEAIEEKGYISRKIPKPMAEVPTPQPSATLSKDELFNMIKRAVREVMEDARVEVPATITITT